MAEALGVVASIIAILQLSDVVVGYLNDVRSASKESNALLIEISATSGVLTTLEKLIRVQDTEASPWLPTVKLLGAQDGPLQLYGSALKRMEELLEPCVKMHRLGSILIWPFKQKEAQKLLEKIQRQHGMFNLALTTDHVYVMSRFNY